jgi:DNA-binding beta-propeller fold protein YncE
MVARAWWTKTVAVVGLLAFTYRVCGQGTLIPDATRRDHVFSPDGSTLYFTGSGGGLQRFSVATGSLLDPIPVGVSLNGIDLTPDGTTAFVTDRVMIGGQGVLRRLDFATGTVSSLMYTPQYPQETHSWDVAIVSNATGFITSSFAGSGNTVRRQIDVANNTLTVRQGVNWIRNRSRLYRSADRSRMVLAEAETTPGNLWNYDTSTDVFSAIGQSNDFLGNAPLAVSRDGALFALGHSIAGTRIYDSAFGIVATLPASTGYVFDPLRDVLYLTNRLTDQIVEYRTSDWSVVSTFPVGENMIVSLAFGEGYMSISDDGQQLAVSTPLGIRVYSIPAPGGVGLLVIAGMASMRRRRR